jgi:hypothetical protein
MLRNIVNEDGNAISQVESPASHSHLVTVALGYLQGGEGKMSRPVIPYAVKIGISWLKKKDLLFHFFRFTFDDAGPKP